MSSNWVVPRRIVGFLSEFTYKVENLLTNDIEGFHASSIKFYADILIGAKAQEKEIAQTTEHIYYAVDRFKKSAKSLETSNC